MTQADLLDRGREDVAGATEFYPTPQALANAIVGRIGDPFGVFTGAPGYILEPSAGDGPFVRAARLRWPKSHITAIDVRHPMKANYEAGADDFFQRDFERIRWIKKFDLILGNPPFSLAVRHIRHALTMLSANGYLAFLLRLSFWETPERAALFHEHPVHAFMPIVQRPKFKGKGGDKTGVGLFVWMARAVPGHHVGNILPPISWR